jgi:glycosyltransferase involved in cell wall biosynthesis
MISIIIPAYQSEDFIEECLNSIKNQTFFIEHSDYEILLGIDACVKTLHKAAVISHNYENLKIFYFNQNVGPYVIKNTLTDYTKYDNILFFDSDDIMEPFLVERALTNFTEHDIARFTFANFTDDVSVKTTGRLADGVFLIKKGKFNDVGGFLPWRCAADTDFHERI